MKSSMTQATHTGMTIRHARFHVTAEKQLYTHEIEHDASDTRRNDCNTCEIPSDRLKTNYKQMK